MNSISSREHYLDISKSIGIWSIVLLHYENGFFPTWLNVFMGSYMITIFYIIVGIVMAKKTTESSVKQLFQRRLKQLGMPYLWWSIIILLFDMLLWAFHYYDNYFVAREMYKTVMLNGIGTLWFLPALFFGEIAWHYMKDKRVMYILIFIAAIACYSFLYSHIFDARQENIYKIARAPFLLLKRAGEASIYIASGYCFYKKFGKYIDAANTWRLLAGGVLLLALAYLSACHLHSIVGSADKYLWMFLAPILGPLAIILLAKAREKTNYLYFFNYWGINSLCLMLIHYSIVLTICQIIDKHVLHNNNYFGIQTLWYFMVSIPILYGMTVLINKKARILLGK